MAKIIMSNPKTKIAFWFICPYVKSNCKWFNGASNAIYGNIACKSIIYKYYQNEIGGGLGHIDTRINNSGNKSLLQPKFINLLVLVARNLF
jgi:hypothetical protein